MLALLIYLILFLKNNFYLNIDDDNGGEMILSNLLTHKNGIHILDRNWYYSSELRVINTQIIYSLLFHISSNWLFVRIFGNIIMYIIMLASVWYLCKQLELSKYFWIIGSMFIIPLSRDYYLFALHSAYLLPHITFSILLMALYIHRRKTQNEKEKRILSTLLFILSFLVGLAGIRHIFVFFIPLSIACILELVFIEKQSFELIVKNTIFTILISASAFCAFIINHFMLKKIFDFSNYHNQNTFFIGFKGEYFEQMINGWLGVYGYKENGSVFSLDLIINTLPMLILLSGYFSIKLVLKKNDKQIRFIALFFIVGVAILSVLFTFTDMMYAQRYLVPISVFIFFLIFYLIDKWEFKYKTQFLIIIVMYISLCVLLNYHDYKSQDDSRDSREVADILLDNGYYQGYSFSFWKYGDNLTEYSNGQIEVWKKIYDSDEFTSDCLYANKRWLEDKSHDFTIPQGKIFLIDDAPINELSEKNIIYKNSTATVYGYGSYEELIEDIEK